MTEEGPPPGEWHDIKSLHFKLFYYKVLPCTKAWSHDWQHCPYTHPNDKARRRSPLHHSYSADMCPAMLQNGTCPKGVNCNLAHNLFEYHLHPDRYKTKMCREGSRCSRIFCFFAHSQDELRTPFSAAEHPPGAAAATAAAGHGPAGSSNSGSSTATNTPVNQPATPIVGRSAAASTHNAPQQQQQQQQLAGAACRTSLEQQQQQLPQLLLQPGSGMLTGSSSISSCGTTLQAPVTACSSGNISGSSCILLMPSGSDSYSQQQQQQQPGAGYSNVLTVCHPGSASMPLRGQYTDGLNQQQQVLGATATWPQQQQGVAPGSFVGSDQVVVGSMGQTLLHVSTQPQLQMINAMPAAAAWAPSAASADQCSAAMGSPLAAAAAAAAGPLQQQAQIISWPGSAAVTSSPCVGISAAIGTLDGQIMQQQQQPAAGQQLQLLLQHDAAWPGTVMLGQQRAVLVPLSMVSGGCAPAALGGMTGSATVALQQQGMPQQQALLVPLTTAGAAAPGAGMTNLVLPQWAV